MPCRKCHTNPYNSAPYYAVYVVQSEILGCLCGLCHFLVIFIVIPKINIIFGCKGIPIKRGIEE